MDMKNSRNLAYDKFKQKHPERIAELRRQASKEYYENHREEVKEKCRERARAKREDLKNIINVYNG